MSEYRKTEPGKTYYLTFSVVEFIPVFTNVVYCNALIDCFNFCSLNKGLDIYGYVIMPDHVHMIAGSDKNLSDIMRDLKGFSAKKIIELIRNSSNEKRKYWMMYIFEKRGSLNLRNTRYQFWQQELHPIEMYDDEIFDQKLEYIHSNPVKAGIVSSPEHYCFSSAHSDSRGIIKDWI